MGRVWVQQSGARTRLEDARERAAGFRRRRRRSGPGGPSDPDASGRVPGAGHQRPAASRRHVAVLGVARGTGSLTSLRPTVRSPRHRVGGARMNRQELVFEQPRELFASTPIETERGTRDAVRLLVTTPGGNRHATFAELPRFLSAGDLLVANESAALAASLQADGPGGTHTLDLRSEEHTSELQSRSDLVCRLLLEKKTKHSGARGVFWDRERTQTHPLYLFYGINKLKELIQCTSRTLPCVARSATNLITLNPRCTD